MNTTLLVKDLRLNPATPERTAITRKAIRGAYSCYSCDHPSADLIDDLKRAGYHVIAEHAVQGRYDSPHRTPATVTKALQRLNPKPQSQNEKPLPPKKTTENKVKEE